MGRPPKLIRALKFGARALLEHKTSRPDGELVTRVHPYRKLMAYIMPSRNGSVVYFESAIRVDPLLEYLEAVGERFPAGLTHCLVAASAIALSENPKMNRFVSGRRLYQRKGRWITFSAKRKKLDREAKLAVIKLEIQPGETFPQLCERIDGLINVERSGEETYLDRELGLLDRLPRPALEAGVKLLKALDYFNVLPGEFIRNDGMYSSLFIANLGSLGMGAGFHHLYEWGNCPLFMTVGAIEERAIVEDGEVKAARILPIRWSYDERIDDGLNARFGLESVKRTLEDPFGRLGGVDPDAPAPSLD